MKRTWGLLLTAVTIVVVDYLTKEWAIYTMKDQPPREYFNGLLYITYLENSGAAFNLGSGMTLLFTLLAIAVSVVIIYLIFSGRYTKWGIGLSLILAGAVGNLVDRLTRPPEVGRGSVIDFISILDPYGNVWPVFNVADMALVSGAIFMLVIELRRPSSKAINKAS